VTVRIDPVEISTLAGARAATPAEAAPSLTGSSAAPSFEAVLGGALGEASAMDATAAQKVSALASGALDDLHGTMISVKEADIAIKLVGTVRNKLLDAFQELWRTSV
jgi:flagellar hook-basal body complex protein FliE